MPISSEHSNATPSRDVIADGIRKRSQSAGFEAPAAIDSRPAPSTRHDAVLRGGIVRTPAASAFLGVSTSCLAKWRVRGEGPPFVRLGKKAVGYEVDALQAWLRAGRRVSTSDIGGGEDA